MCRCIALAAATLSLSLCAHAFCPSQSAVGRAASARPRRVAARTAPRMVSGAPRLGGGGSSSSSSREKSASGSGLSDVAGAGGSGDFEFDRFMVGTLKGAINSLFNDRDYARFYALETIARVPYFSYLSCLHLYETLGWWRKADYLKLHFAESYNELHHLLIMEALGGADSFLDRLLAQHVAVAYFLVASVLYMSNPKAAYHLNQLVEEHAFATYEAFLASHGEELKKLPAPEVAVRYYTEDGLYLFNGVGPAEHHSEAASLAAGGALGLDRRSSERPSMETLYDVFVAVRDDEKEHVKTMVFLQEELSRDQKK